MSDSPAPKVRPVEERLAVNETRPGRESHLAVSDPERCADCDGPCITVCPAGTYTVGEESGKLIINFENCLECGACRAVCRYGVIKWKNPLGGTGVCYRYG